MSGKKRRGNRHCPAIKIVFGEGVGGGRGRDANSLKWAFVETFGGTWLQRRVKPVTRAREGFSSLRAPVARITYLKSLAGPEDDVTDRSP